MILAADYPLLDVFWTILLFFTWVIWIYMMVVILTDVFRRGDIGGWTKAAWTVFLIVLPFLGALVYLIKQHDRMAERRLQDIQVQRGQLDDHIRSVAGSGTSGAAAEIAQAKQLLDDHAIDQAEFEQLKRNALAAA